MKKPDYNRQKKTIYWIIGIGILFLLFANTIAWIYLQRIKIFFETDLKFRMENIVQISGKFFDADYLSFIVPGDENKPQVIYYQQLLFDIKEKNNLQDIYIISPANELLIDVNPDFQIGNLKRSTDQELIKTALAGYTTSSAIYTLGDHRFLTAALPLMDEINSVNAILIAEARAEFFTVFEEFNNGLFIFSLINAIIIITATFFLYRSLKNLIDLQNQIKNQEHLVKLGEMAAAVAHEIRNPLGIIRGTNEMIQKKYGNDDDEFFQYIPAELKRLNQLINDFLSLSRNQELKFENVNLESLIKKIIFGFELNEKHKIDYSIDENAKMINTDTNLLEQILLNILKNSLQSIGESGQIEIKISKINKKEYQFRIQDNGIGIDKVNLQKVFQPFYTTKEKGSGLGLAITKRLAEQLGGEILIESQPNLGTTTTIIISKLQ